MSFVQKFQGTKTSLFRIRQRITYLEKAPSFLRGGLFPPPANPLSQPSLWYFAERAATGGAGTPASPVHSPAQSKRALPAAAARPTPGQTRACHHGTKRRATALGPRAAPPPGIALPWGNAEALRSIFRAAPSQLRASALSTAAALSRFFAITSLLKPKIKPFQRFFSFYFKRGHFSRESASLSTSGRDFPALRSHEPVVKNKSKAGGLGEGSFRISPLPRLLNWTCNSWGFLSTWGLLARYLRAISAEFVLVNGDVKTTCGFTNL